MKPQLNKNFLLGLRLLFWSALLGSLFPMVFAFSFPLMGYGSEVLTAWVNGSLVTMGLVGVSGVFLVTKDFWRRRSLGSLFALLALYTLFGTVFHLLGQTDGLWKYTWVIREFETMVGAGFMMMVAKQFQLEKFFQAWLGYLVVVAATFVYDIFVRSKGLGLHTDSPEEAFSDVHLLIQNRTLHWTTDCLPGDHQPLSKKNGHCYLILMRDAVHTAHVIAGGFHGRRNICQLLFTHIVIPSHDPNPLLIGHANHCPRIVVR